MQIDAQSYFANIQRLVRVSRRLRTGAVAPFVRTQDLALHRLVVSSELCFSGLLCILLIWNIVNERVLSEFQFWWTLVAQCSTRDSWKN